MNRSAIDGRSRRISSTTRRKSAAIRRPLTGSPPTSAPSWRNACSRSSVPARARISRPVPRAMTLPDRMNRSSSQRSASSMTWLDTTIVVPASARARKWVQNWTRRSGSTPTVGSSRNRTGGRWMSAQASDRRRRWPPDRVPGDRVRPVAELDQVERRRGPPRRPGRRTSRRRSGRSRRRSARGRSRRSGSCSRSGSGSPATASARRGPRPGRAVARASPVRSRMSVVLPEPFGPSRP